MISFIWAMDMNRAIGFQNKLPWHLPEDLKFFKRVTMGHPVIMGRKTHESIGRLLPGRENIVLTRDPNFQSDGIKVMHSVEEIFHYSRETNEELFVIGGAEIFNELFPVADKLYLTMIHEEFQGDTYFPQFPIDDWKLVSSEKGITDEKNPYDFEFLIYERKKQQ